MSKSFNITRIQLMVADACNALDHTEQQLYIHGGLDTTFAELEAQADSVKRILAAWKEEIAKCDT